MPGTHLIMPRPQGTGCVSAGMPRYEANKGMIGGKRGNEQYSYFKIAVLIQKYFNFFCCSHPISLYVNSTANAAFWTESMFIDRETILVD
jgi:hypothetical protein